MRKDPFKSFVLLTDKQMFQVFLKAKKMNLELKGSEIKNLVIMIGREYKVVEVNAGILKSLYEQFSEIEFDGIE